MPNKYHPLWQLPTDMLSDADRATIAAAADSVLALPELCEAILEELDDEDFVMAAAAGGHFLHTIAGSAKLMNRLLHSYIYDRVLIAGALANPRLRRVMARDRRVSTNQLNLTCERSSSSLLQNLNIFWDEVYCECSAAGKHHHAFDSNQCSFNWTVPHMDLDFFGDEGPVLTVRNYKELVEAINANNEYLETHLMNCDCNITIIICNTYKWVYSHEPDPEFQVWRPASMVFKTGTFRILFDLIEKFYRAVDWAYRAELTSAFSEDSWRDFFSGRDWDYVVAGPKWNVEDSTPRCPTEEEKEAWEKETRYLETLGCIVRLFE